MIDVGLDELHRELQRHDGGRGAPRLGTLGPEGTTSHHIAVWLLELVGSARPRSLQLELYPSFPEVLAAIESDKIELALVPSAFAGATEFHWSPCLRLLLHFARATPAYGLAYSETVPAQGSEVVVAALPEVRRLLADLRTDALRAASPRWLDAQSTVEAARMAADGRADFAITNEFGRRVANLTWLSARAGPQIVWMVFAPMRCAPLTGSALAGHSHMIEQERDDE